MTNALAPYARAEPRTIFRRLLRRLPVQLSPERAYFRQHDTALEIRQTLSEEIFDTFFSFGVVRNPFDHAISYYEFMKEHRNRRHAERARSMSFRDNLLYRLAPRPFYDKPFFRLPNQSYYLCDAAGKILVNEVLRYETLSVDLQALFQRLHLPPLPLGLDRKSSFRKPGHAMADYYDDPATIDLVRQLYGPDFEIFGYSDDPF